MENGREEQDERRVRYRRMEEDLHDLALSVAVLRSQVLTLKEEIEKLITRVEFAPVKLLTYGLAATLLSGVVAAILAQVIKHGL